MRRSITITQILTFFIIAAVAFAAVFTFVRADEVTSGDVTTDAEATSDPESSTSETPEETTEEPPRTVIGLIVDYGTGRTSFYEGECFSASGYTAKLFYSDSTFEDVDSSALSFSPVDPLTADVSAITFTCALAPDTSATKKITVIPATGLEVVGSCKTEYRAGEDRFEPEGLEFFIKFGDDTVSAYPVPLESCTITPGADLPIPSGLSEVTVGYQFCGKELTAAVPVTVRVPVSVTIHSGPEALYEGYPLSLTPDDFTVTALYEGEAEEIEVHSFIIENLGAPVAPGVDGTATVTLTLDTLSAAYQITVVRLVPDSVGVSGTIRNYYLGDIPSFDGVRVTFEWEDGTVADVTEYVEAEVPESYTPGAGIIARFGLTEIPLDSVVRFHVPSITIIRSPDKTEYFAGEVFDITGLAAVITYDDGTHQQNLPAEELTLVSTAPLAVTDSSVVVAWNGIEAEIVVKVFNGKKIQSITVTKNPDKVIYIEGEPLDLTGIEIRIDYVDGTAEPLTDMEAVTAIPEIGAPMMITGKPVSIRYTLSSSLYFEAVLRDITIVTSNVTAVAVTTMPSKQEYNEGDEFAPAGMVVTAILDNGNMEVIAPEAYTISSPEMIDGRFVLKESAAGYRPVSVVVTYNGISCLLNVDVLPKSVRTLSAAEPPALTEYVSGEYFNPAGMVVRIEYADGTTVDLPEGYYTTDPVRPLAVSDKSVSVLFRDSVISIPITVTAASGQTETTTSGSGEESSVPDVTTSPYTGPETTTQEGTTGTETTSSPETTSDGTSSSGCVKINKIILLWIIIIVIIAAALIGLVIYYRRNFT